MRARGAVWAGCMGLLGLVTASACRAPDAPPSGSSTPAAAGEVKTVPKAPAAGPSASKTNSATPPASPLSWKQLPTTDGSIALANLEGDLANARRFVATKATPATRAMLLQLLLLHGGIVGRLDEYDEADALAKALVDGGPKDPQAHRLHAEVDALFHRFDQALAELATVEKLGGAAAGTAERHGLLAKRASILQAVGRYAEARALREAAAKERPTIETLGALAILDAEEGDVQAAERLFTEAQGDYKDVSPLPVAWLWLQQGTMWQGAGRLARARELLAAAHERLPADAQAANHLAQVLAAQGDTDGAERLLRPLVAASDDPEHAALLAEVVEKRAPEEAKALRERARARYDALLAKHPEAFADHAARFFLGGGHDAARALALGEKNLMIRPTAEAHALVVEAAMAAGDGKRACAVAAKADQFPRAQHLQALAWKALTACHDEPRAQAALARMARSDAAPGAAPTGPTAATAPDAAAPTAR